MPHRHPTILTLKGLPIRRYGIQFSPWHSLGKPSISCQKHVIHGVEGLLEIQVVDFQTFALALPISCFVQKGSQVGQTIVFLSKTLLLCRLQLVGLQATDYPVLQDPIKISSTPDVRLTGLKLSQFSLPELLFTLMTVGASQPAIY